jgi:hypothetical protein
MCKIFTLHNRLLESMGETNLMTYNPMQNDEENKRYLVMRKLFYYLYI